MSARPWVTVSINVATKTGYVSGGGKDLVEKAGGKLYWLPTRRVWSTTAAIASDILAIAESEGRPCRYVALGGEAS